jgi:hypothetical protein
MSVGIEINPVQQVQRLTAAPYGAAVVFLLGMYRFMKNQAAVSGVLGFICKAETFRRSGARFL